MAVDDGQIGHIEKIVREARAEFGQAAACHEAWRPMAFDKDLAGRMGRSYASNTFMTIREALRREVILSLMKLWDRGDDSTSFPKVMEALKSPRVVDHFAAVCAAPWGEPPAEFADDIPEEARAEVVGRVEESERLTGLQFADDLRIHAREALRILESYSPGGDKHQVVHRLKLIRNKRLAHRDLDHVAQLAEYPTPDDEAVELFYQDMSQCVRLLTLVVANMDYRPQETAAIHKRHAEIFWRGVRGERTEGHPDYVPPRHSIPRDEDS